MAQAGTTDDFASAALVGLLRRALADAGLQIPEVPGPARGALLPLTSKRDLLVTLAGAHGLQPIIAAGRHLTQVTSDPAAAALLAAADPTDLFARWGRLERFVHSRHRVAVREAGDRYLVAEHVSLTDEPPLAPEDALILGVMASALAAIGAVVVTVRLGAEPSAPLVIRGDAIHEPETGRPTALWRFEWHEVIRPTRATQPPTTDDVAALRRLVAADPARRWTVAAATAVLGMSARSLQRALEPAGGFTAVVGAVRAEHAGDLLMNSAHPLSLVGFVCGYADQPHFTREFKRRTAMTPAAYRQGFAAGRSAG